MDKRKLKAYVGKIPKAFLYNGSEQYVVATDNLDDILVIKIFFKCNKSELARSYSLCWVHFYSDKEKDYITYDLTGTYKTKWRKVKICDIISGYTFSDYYESDKQGIVLTTHRRECVIQAARLQKRYELAIKEFKEFNKQVRKVPKKFFEWIENNSIPGYGLYNNRNKTVKCTKCGCSFNREKVTRGENLICPECRKHIKALPIGHYRVDTAGYCAFAQKCRYGLVIRYFEWTDRMSSTNVKARSIFEYRRDFIDNSGESQSYVFFSYKQSGYIGFIPAEHYHAGMRYYLCNEPFMAFTTSAEFWYGCSRYLKGSDFKYYVLEHKYRTDNYRKLIENDVSYYFTVFAKYPAVETLLKNGQYELVKAALHKYPRIKEKEVVPSKALGLSRNLILRLGNSCTPELLETIQFLHKAKQYISNEVIDFFSRQNVRISDLDKLIKHNLHKIIRYINRQGSSHYIVEYIDYLDCCKQLNIKMNKSNLYPQNLMVAHNEVVSKINIEKDRLKNEQYKELKRTYLKKYKQMEIKDLIIRLPKDIGEIAYEGLMQHNCVGHLYINRILDRRSDILFVRKKDSPAEPYVTLEVFNGKIIQCRYKYNQACGSDITDIVEEYLNIINNEEMAA